MSMSLAVPVAARCRAENRQVDGRDLPRPDLIAQTALELRSHVGKKLNRRRGEVFAVERVQVRPARLMARTRPSSLNRRRDALTDG